MRKAHAEDLAFALLREVITRARNGEPYKEHLESLKQALVNAPKIAKVIKQTWFE